MFPSRLLGAAGYSQSDKNRPGGENSFRTKGHKGRAMNKIDTRGENRGKRTQCFMLEWTALNEMKSLLVNATDLRNCWTIGKPKTRLSQSLLKSRSNQFAYLINRRKLPTRNAQHRNYYARYRASTFELLSIAAITRSESCSNFFRPNHTNDDSQLVSIPSNWINFSYFCFSLFIDGTTQCQSRIIFKVNHQRSCQLCTARFIHHIYDELAIVFRQR